MADTQGAPEAVWAFAEHEHRDLMRGIDRIHDVACQIDSWVTPDLAVHVRDILRWLDNDLGPHISWEESWLYPVIDARTGTPWATRSARFDHRQIRDMAALVRADQDVLLAHAAKERLPDLRCHLFGLEALLRAHLEREERYLIPMLADDIRAGSTGSADPDGSIVVPTGSGSPAASGAGPG
jgi:iron-sulfur cluster repair protein YtfE (RIC family)